VSDDGGWDRRGGDGEIGRVEAMLIGMNRQSGCGVSVTLLCPRFCGQPVGIQSVIACGQIVCKSRLSDSRTSLPHSIFPCLYLRLESFVHGRQPTPGSLGLNSMLRGDIVAD